MSESEAPTTMSRRQLIRHSAWFGAAIGLAVVGGEVISHVAGAGTATETRPTLRFAQVSDSHIGFTGPANTDVTGSFGRAVDQLNNLGYQPDFVIHTGDLTHLATPGQFDQVKQMLSGLNTPHVFTVPGEHDSVDDARAVHADATDAVSDQRFRLMERRLFIMMTLGATLAVLFGLTIIALQPAWLGATWLRVKLLLVLGLLGYHHWCWRLLLGFRRGQNARSSRWYRGFNEIPSVLLLAIVFLAILKPA